MQNDGPGYHGRTHCPGGSDPIPCLAPSILDWVWVISLGAVVDAGDGTTAGNAAKFATGAYIHGTTRPDFTSVSETFNTGSGWYGTEYTGDVLRVPAGIYLAAMNMTSWLQGPGYDPFEGPWQYRAFAKWPTVGWDHEDDPLWQTDLWKEAGHGPGDTPAPLDFTVIPQNLAGLAPIQVYDVDNGYGLLTLQIINYDAAQHLYTDGFLFLISMTLATSTDGFH